MNLQKFSEEYYNELLKLHHDLCLIPAPSHYEDERAKYILECLKDAGIENAYIDEAKNVVCKFGKPSDKMVVFMAHTDTVFPMDTPLDYVDDGENIYCPGVGDDTASLAVMLVCIKYIAQNGIVPEKSLMFVANSCEEGLGNLKGCRQIFKDYGDKIEYMYSFDAKPTGVTNKSVGSHRYEITAITEGGHSFGAFGNRNAISVLAEIINEIYKIEVPQTDGSITTYNVGTISGGTSVNTIAQNAKMLCEYRSNNKKCMGFMEQKFEEIFENCRCDEVKVDVRLVGDRPCGDIDESKMDHFKSIVVPVIEGVIDKKVKFKTASTDCNIPLSLGIPALGVGLNIHSGVHTYEEWVDKKSMIDGFEIALRLGLALS